MDDAIMVRQTARKERAHVTKMRRLFVTADTDRDGRLDRGEWLALCEDPWVKAWLKAQDFDLRDPGILFAALDDGSGTLTAQELVEGTSRMKSEASPMAMVRLVHEVNARVKVIESRLRENPEHNHHT
ncbi:unnamed protein product [Prorocentrum cordatum]|uniref:EF-hand domain-containing protein n=1 Tax=Prorocentrum cordatum TaxID=2364126 RepID=A0ABN9WB50_9DINO|nr:unnamed protein product [Polarella glacialis]